MILSSVSADSRAMRASFCCSSLSAVSISNPIMPMTPFIGVRISWLMVARKSDFARVAISAASRASCSSLLNAMCSSASLL
jgi:hypothetical protein